MGYVGVLIHQYWRAWQNIINCDRDKDLNVSRQLEYQNELIDIENIMSDMHDLW